MSGVAGVILAGGRSERFSGGGGGAKALAPLQDAPMILQVAANLVRGGAKRIIALTGRNHAQMCAELAGGAERARLSLSEGDGTRCAAFELRPSGDDAGTGGRLLALAPEEIGEAALLSYTDILSDADPGALLAACKGEGTALVMLAVHPPSPWGELRLEGEQITGFREKAVDRTRWINGGLFAISAGILSYVRAPSEMLEVEPIQRLLAAGAARVVRHEGWWQTVDTAKDLRQANDEAQARRPGRPGADIWLEPA